METSCFRRGALQPNRRLVLLHGWGADGDDLLPVAEELVPEAERRGIELLGLRAPHRHPDGIGRAWYDLTQPSWDGLLEARLGLANTLRLLAEEIPLPRTALLGFSQGGAMAVDVASHFPVGLILACSAYPHPHWQPPRQHQSLWLSHGEEDSVVPIQAGLALRDAFRLSNGELTWHPFKGGHAIDGGLIGPMRTALGRCWLDPVQG